MRELAVFLHRWVGLVIAGFLVLAGATGALLAFNHELDRALNPRLMLAAPPEPGAVPIDPLELRERVQQAYPDAWVHYATLHREPGRAQEFWLEGPTDPATGAHRELANDQVFVDPYRGRVLGARKWGDITQGLTNLMPFIYRLHYQVALGVVGTWTFGIVALLWTIDCFVSAWLTLPPRRRASAGSRWWARWQPAWRVRVDAGVYKLNFDLHRAGGLWLWAMLFVLAWSSVGFNLPSVYQPVMGALFAHQPVVDHVPKLARDQAQPGLDWPAALAVGRALMQAEAAAEGFAVERELAFSYDPHKALFRYQVRSDRDIRDTWGSTSVYFDANTGERRGAYLPTGKAAGDTIDTWLYSLHMAAIWGLPFKIFISVMGIVVVALSGTGVYIWLKKRRARASRPVRADAPARPRLEASS